MTHLLTAAYLFLTFYAQVPSFSKEMSEKFYYGVENPISIKMNGANPDDVKIKLVPGTLYKRNDSTFVYVPNQEIPELKIKLYYKNIIVDSRVVMVERIPTANITIRFDTEIDGKISLSQLGSTSKLLLEYNADYPVQLHNKINNYILSCKNLNGGMSIIQVNGELISEEAKLLLKNLKKGDTLTLSNITGRNASNQYSNLGSKLVVVVD